MQQTSEKSDLLVPSPNKSESVLKLSLLHYLIAGLVPLALLITSFAPMVLRPLLFSDFIASHRLLAAGLSIVLLSVLDTLFIKLSSRFTGRHYTPKRRWAVIILSALALGATFYALNVWALWNIEHGLPDYAKLPNFHIDLLYPLQVTFVILAPFIGLNVLFFDPQLLH